jgi:hypothetical protein
MVFHVYILTSGRALLTLDFAYRSPVSGKSGSFLAVVPEDFAVFLRANA